GLITLSDKLIAFGPASNSLAKLFRAALVSISSRTLILQMAPKGEVAVVGNYELPVGLLRPIQRSHELLTMNKRTHVVIPEQLVKDIDTLVGSRQRSVFLVQAAEEKLMRYRQLKAIESAAGTWKDKDHPELKRGAAKHVSKMRRQDK